MADKVHTILERMVPELEDFQINSIFSPVRLHTITTALTQPQPAANNTHMVMAPTA